MDVRIRELHHEVECRVRTIESILRTPRGTNFPSIRSEERVVEIAFSVLGANRNNPLTKRGQKRYKRKRSPCPFLAGTKRRIFVPPHFDQHTQVASTKEEEESVDSFLDERQVEPILSLTPSASKALLDLHLGRVLNFLRRCLSIL